MSLVARTMWQMTHKIAGLQANGPMTEPSSTFLENTLTLVMTRGPYSCSTQVHSSRCMTLKVLTDTSAQKIWPAFPCCPSSSGAACRLRASLYSVNFMISLMSSRCLCMLLSAILFRRRSMLWM